MQEMAVIGSRVWMVEYQWHEVLKVVLVATVVADQVLMVLQLLEDSGCGAYGAGNRRSGGGGGGHDGSGTLRGVRKLPFPRQKQGLDIVGDLVW